MNLKERLLKWTVLASLYLFWPGLFFVTWGELTPHPPAWTEFFWDKSLHFTAYFGLAAMATLVLGNGRKLLWALVALAIFGGLLELLQGFTGRDPDIHDEIANGIGLVAGYVVASAFAFALGRRSLVAKGGAG